MAKTMTMLQTKNLPTWVMSILMIVGFFIILRLLKRVSLLEAEAEKENDVDTDLEKKVLKNTITKYMDENEGKLSDVKFSIVGKFQQITKDNEKIKEVMRAAMNNDRAKLNEILKSL